MSDIGFLYNCSLNTNPAVRSSPSIINRAALIDSCLRESGQRIFFYSPRHVRESEPTVPGYHLDGGEFVRARAPVPRVNGNWTYATRTLIGKGMGYRRFLQWSERQRIGIYVPHAFSELVRNKFETYKLVRAYHETLHPHCEPYRQSGRQLEHFLSNAETAFIKPRAGSKGNRIVSLRKEGRGLAVTWYAGGRRKHCTADSPAAARDFIDDVTRGRKGYLIQEGVSVMRHQGRVFDIRVIMINDGETWNWLHEVRESDRDSEISNISQGGTSIATEDLLFDLLGYEGARNMLNELQGESFGLAAFLERLHPGEIMEIAFDFVIDREGRLRLIEINTKPGLAGIGFLCTVFEMRPAQRPLFERWVHPHTTGLARFLQKKSREPG